MTKKEEMLEKKVADTIKQLKKVRAEMDKENAMIADGSAAGCRLEDIYNAIVALERL